MKNKYKVLIILFVTVISRSYCLNEQWYFNNLFMQLIQPGNITFQNFPYNIIESIQFTETIAFATSPQIKRASIRMMDENDITRTYDCNYLDMGNIITLQIFVSNDIIDLILYIVRISNNIWYSYTVSLDIEKGIVKGIKENETQYINYIGIIRRN